ncbi:hypothetical protein A0H81_00336 [Grifola frondosa]|uniref:Uncharacterized protein n=1 Tax=Grifola frondosa TaxID=5627 RepID=A0A1C7MSC8_GRIFR|nr:hypothetical protein A0H81_00336 [Grifola frondosa]
MIQVSTHDNDYEELSYHPEESYSGTARVSASALYRLAQYLLHCIGLRNSFHLPEKCWNSSVETITEKTPRRIEAEMLEYDNMAWGRPSSRRR